MTVDKETALKMLEQKIRETPLPLAESNLVFGEGNPDCDVLFIGEAPGFNEDRLGRPFVGRAGKLLDEMIVDLGWKRSDVYITNIVKRRPPDNRDPLPAEIDAYKPFLLEQIEIINPPVIATLGRFSMNYFLPFAKITRDQGKIFDVSGRVIFPLLHPAAALRNPSAMKDLRESFKKLPEAARRAKDKTATEEPPTNETVNRPKSAQKSLF